MTDKHNLVGLFGGTFNPVHRGHLQSIELLEVLIQFEAIHWILSARPPHKDNVIGSIEDRFEMLKLALNDVDTYIANDIEIQRPDISYTIDTIEQFKKDYPNNNLCLIIGEDSLINFTSWHRYLDILDNAHLVVLARPGYEFLAGQIIDGALDSTVDNSINNNVNTNANLNEFDGNELLDKTVKASLLELCEDRLITNYQELSNSRNGKIAYVPQTDFNISSTFIRQRLARIDAKNISSDDDVMLNTLIPSKVLEYIKAKNMYVYDSTDTNKTDEAEMQTRI